MFKTQLLTRPGLFNPTLLEIDVKNLANACEGLLTLIAMYKVEMRVKEEEIRQLQEHAQATAQKQNSWTTVHNSGAHLEDFLNHLLSQGLIS